MKVVSFETAKRLKEAGFPQPQTFFGQIWHLRYNQRYVLIGTNEGHIAEHQDRVFAPSATDILNHLRGNYRLSCSNFGWWCDRVEEWPDLAHEFRIVACYNDENPAEACAAAWLFVHEKTSTT